MILQLINKILMVKGEIMNRDRNEINRNMNISDLSLALNPQAPTTKGKDPYLVYHT